MLKIQNILNCVKYVLAQLFIASLIFTINLSAQEAGTSDYNREAVNNPDNSTSTNPDAESDTDSTFFFGDNSGQPVLDEPELLAQNTTTTNTGGNSGTRNVAGFAETAWQTTFSAVRTRLGSLATSDTSNEQVEIVAIEANKFILVKRNDILYRYNFYRTPYEVALLKNHELSREEHDQIDALLFHVKVITPFIAAAQIKEKLVKKHGPNTRTTVDKKKGDGVNIWEVGSGLIFQWYEPYHRKPFTRSVDFISVDMAKKIMAEYAIYFDAPERLLLQKIILK